MRLHAAANSAQTPVSCSAIPEPPRAARSLKPVWRAPDQLHPRPNTPELMSEPTNSAAAVASVPGTPNSFADIPTADAVPCDDATANATNGDAEADSYPTVYNVSDSPKCFMIDNFLDDATCDELRALACPRLLRSRVASGVGLFDIQQYYFYG